MEGTDLAFFLSLLVVGSSSLVRSDLVRFLAVLTGETDRETGERGGKYDVAMRDGVGVREDFTVIGESIRMKGRTENTPNLFAYQVKSYPCKPHPGQWPTY